MNKFLWTSVSSALFLASCTQAGDAPESVAAVGQPAPVIDCPLRDAPYSIGSPMFDILLNPAAMAVVEKYLPEGALAKLPPIFKKREVPSFATILDVRAVTGMAGLNGEKLTALDTELRTLAVSAEDKVARCARYDNDVPTFTLEKGKPSILVFEKINGFKDTPSVDAAHAAIEAMAARKGWNVVFTQSGGAFNAKTLAQFDAVLWNNISGDVLTLSQRSAFQEFLAQGGGYVGLHGSAGDPTYFWDWYPDTLIGARFAGHPSNPQFQETRVIVNGEHVLSEGLPTEWRMTDEWYAFKSNPKASGATVLLSLDESLYTHQGYFGEDLSMGGDHPIAWTKCIGKGRMFYSAIGHLPETYTHPINVRVMENGLNWAISAKAACPA